MTEQELNGKWLLKQIDSGNGKKGYPGFQLLEINNDSVDIYTDFSLEKIASTLLMNNGDLLNSNNEIVSKYKILDENHLKTYIDGKSNDKDAIFECDFYRLEPTITTLTKENIEKMIFVIGKNDRQDKFVFNKELWDNERLKLFKRIEGEKKMIEKIDSTFFVSMYYNGKRHGSFPIKEVTTELINVYGIPNQPNGMVGYRKE